MCAFAAPCHAQAVSRAILPPDMLSESVVAKDEVISQAEESLAIPHAQPKAESVELLAVHAPAGSTQVSPPRSSDRLVRCVAQAVYHEARGESVKGQQAVADVVANRARSGRWGDHCGVVDAPRQFSGRSGWSSPRPGVDAWDRALEIARKAVSGTILVSRRFTNFRAVSMGGPKGATIIGRHIFW